MKSKLISIIIVTWNNGKVIKKCIESILNSTDPIEIVIVDNQSTDNTIDIIKEFNFEDINLIQPNENLGFAKANNLGVSHAQGEYILLLNPDTILKKVDLLGLTRLLNDKVGLIGCKLLNQDGTLQPSCYCFDTPKNIILEQFMLGKLIPEALKKVYTPYLSKHNTQMFVDWLVGAFLLITKKDYERIGGFSTEYFLYAEDMDIAYKIHEISKRVLFDPSNSIVHLGGVSEKQDVSSSKQEKMLQSRMIFAHKYHYRFNMKVFLISYRIKTMITSFTSLFSKQSKRNKSRYEQTVRLIEKIM